MPGQRRAVGTGPTTLLARAMPLAARTAGLRLAGSSIALVDEADVGQALLARGPRPSVLRSQACGWYSRRDRLDKGPPEVRMVRVEMVQRRRPVGERRPGH